MEKINQVNELLEVGLIHSSSSPFSSLILLVHKKDMYFRMCVHYQALNMNCFPIPLIDDMFDGMIGEKMFSHINLKSDYHQVQIINGNIHKLAIRATFGLYEFLVSPFGLTNSPVIFASIMVQECLDAIDAIVLYSSMASWYSIPPKRNIINI